MAETPRVARASLFEGLTFKVADVGERARAIDLRRRVYAEDVGHVEMDDLDERAHHLVCHDDSGEVIAALRVVLFDDRPFDIEHFVALDGLIPSDRFPAEIGRYCVRNDHRRVTRNHFVQLGMLKLAYAFARKRGATDFLMYTFGHLLDFYRGAFFQLLDVAFEHPGYSQQMYVMRLDLVDFENRYSQSQQPVARLLFKTNFPNIIV